MGSIDLKDYFMKIAYSKLEKELKDYKRQMFQLSAEEVFGRAYEIDCFINIYEILLIKIENLTPAQLWGIVIIPHILSFFYLRWLNIEDNYAHELDEAIDGIILHEWNLSNKPEPKM